MDHYALLSDFFRRISSDPRISITHIGLYAAVLEYWKAKEYKSPFQVFSYEIMPIAKISASTTYHKCIRELSEYGYLVYVPSFKRNQGSKIYMIIK